MFPSNGSSHKIANFLCDISSNEKVLKLKQCDQNVKYYFPPLSLSSSRVHCKEITFHPIMEPSTTIVEGSKILWM